MNPHRTMNKNVILSAALGVFIGGIFLSMAYLVIVTKIESDQNTSSISSIANFINQQVKADSAPVPTK